MFQYGIVKSCVCPFWLPELSASTVLKDEKEGEEGDDDENEESEEEEEEESESEARKDEEKNGRVYPESEGWYRCYLPGDLYWLGTGKCASKRIQAPIIEKEEEKEDELYDWGDELVNTPPPSSSGEEVEIEMSEEEEWPVIALDAKLESAGHTPPSS